MVYKRVPRCRGVSSLGVGGILPRERWFEAHCTCGHIFIRVKSLFLLFLSVNL